VGGRAGERARALRAHAAFFFAADRVAANGFRFWRMFSFAAAPASRGVASPSGACAGGGGARAAARASAASASAPAAALARSASAAQ